MDGLAQANISMRLRHLKLSGNVEIRQYWSKKTGSLELVSKGVEPLRFNTRIPSSRSKEKTHPNHISQEWNMKTPLKFTQVISETARGAEFFSGRRRGQKAKATSYEQEGKYITRWIGQYPSRKVADVTLVSYPKNL